MVRTRIAPSPTGIPHIGNTRTALYNYLFARHHNGKFILRIEDTDRARLVPESEKAIYEILEWLGLAWDEKYTQSERLSIYKKYADELKERSLVYEDNGALRFRMPKAGETRWKDAIGNKDISFPNAIQEDFIIIKSDGYPTYNFANVIDDHLMDISHVIRGDEFISSTPKHIQLYKAFGWKHPIFAHLPVILGPDKQKLSKRHGAKSALDYRDEGYLKEALLNFMALLGWSPGDDREIIDLPTMIKFFDLEDVNSGSPIFDSTKLEWMNGVYIRKLSVEELKAKLKTQNSKLKNIEDALLSKFVALAQTRINTLNDFYPLVTPFLEEHPASPDRIHVSGEQLRIAKKLKEALDPLESWKSDKILAAVKRVLEKENIRMPVLYNIFTGEEKGLPLPQSLEIIGKEKTMEKLKKS